MIKNICYDDFIKAKEAAPLTIGEKIHDLRIRNNMTMDDLARELGVQRSAINKYEKGIVVNLKRSTIAGLCRVFGVSSSYFLDDDPKPVTEEDNEIRIVSGMMENMTKEQKEQIVAIVRAVVGHQPH